MSARRIHRVADAPNDGVRRLRELRRFTPAAKLAKRVGCSERQMRRWISGECMPETEWRRTLEELGIPEGAWELAPGDSLAATVPRGGG